MCRLAQAIHVHALEPEIKILGRAGCAFDQCGAHADDQVADAQRVQRLEQRPLSRCEDEVEHG